VGTPAPGVEQIQTALKAAGYDIGVDGVFGQVTDRAVRDYQGKNGLAVDGIVGPNTWAKLGSASTASATTTSTTTA
jgi:peptidoglycan hydrolase-like protein with peptidoglycan-binding domain